MFHVKHFCPIGEAEYSRPHTHGGLQASGIARKLNTFGGFEGAALRGCSFDPKRFSKGGGGHMVGMEINLEGRRNLDAWPQ
jgi:hypothetical protein